MKLESDQNSLAHCGRRNNAVLTRIPEIVKGNELEDVVLKIFNDIDANVQSSNIEICHRFSKPEQEKSKKRRQSLGSLIERMQKMSSPTRRN